MKVKGVNWFEAHVEWLLVGLLALAGLAAVALQFVGQGNRVEVNRRQMALPEAYGQVVTEAQLVQGRLEATTTPEGLPEEVPDLASALRSELSQGVDPENRLAQALTLVFRPVVEDGGRVASLEAVYAPAQPPAPTDIAARAFIGTLDPGAVASIEGLAAALEGEDQPFDVRAVSVGATFDAGAMMQRFGADPDGASGPLQPIPRFLWNDAEIADVQLERERLGSDGRWVDRELVAPLPGRASLRADLGSVEDRAAKRRLDARARESREQIVRPAYYRMIAGDAWAPPAAAVAPRGEALPANVARQIQRLVSRQQDLESLRAELEALDAEPQSSVDDRQPSRGVANARQPSGPFQPATPTQQDRDRERDERAREREQAARQQSRQQLQDRIARAEEEIQRLRDWLTERGVDPEAALGRTETVREEWTPEPVQALNSGGSVRVWGHDLGVEPGETYRYRARVLVMNPLFGMADNLQGDAKSEAQRAAVASDWSDWSGAVRVAPEAQVFFTASRSGADNAIGGGGVGAVSASAEVYRYYYGHWRKATIRLAPGDAVAAEIQAPSLPLWDVEVDTERGVVRTQERPQGTPTRLEIATDAFLLDVIPQADSESGGGGAQVVFRDESGRIEVRTPGADRASPARQQAEQSSVTGLTSRPTPPVSGSVGPARERGGGSQRGS